MQRSQTKAATRVLEKAASGEALTKPLHCKQAHSLDDSNRAGLKRIEQRGSGTSFTS